MSTQSALINAEWLLAHLKDDQLVLLDATLDQAVNAAANDLNQIIPGALKVNWDAFSDLSSSLPHTLASETQLKAAIASLGITEQSRVVLYDRTGIYGSPRIWWILRAMGLENVSILNGGLPNWIAKHYPLATTYRQVEVNKFNKTSFQSDFFVDAQEVLAASQYGYARVVDARAENRFNGTQAEPRKGLRSGHIPNSINIPFDRVLNKGFLRSPEELAAIFAAVDDRPLIFSCGSGVTACILALAAHEINRKEIRVYDGSWTEWASDGELPIHP